MPRERQTAAELPIELEPELFGYRRPTPANEQAGREIIAQKSGYSSAAELQAAIADGTCEEGVASAWEAYLAHTAERQLENAKVVRYLDRANLEARSIRRLNRRVAVLEAEVDALLARVTTAQPNRPTFTEEELG